MTQAYSFKVTFTDAGCTLLILEASKGAHRFSSLELAILSCTYERNKVYKLEHYMLKVIGSLKLKICVMKILSLLSMSLEFLFYSLSLSFSFSFFLPFSLFFFFFLFSPYRFTSVSILGKRAFHCNKQVMAR